MGDVDLYYLDNTNESGKFWFSVENAPSTAGASSRSDYALTVKLCRVWESSNGVKTRYLRSELVEKTVDPGRKKTFIFNLEPDYDYFVYIYSSKLPFTADTLASLPNGTYTVIMEFFGKASIGQPITLTVTGNSVTEGETVVLNTVIMEPNSNANWHWAACAKMMANSRLRREGSAVSTLSLAQGINGAFGSSHLTSIGDIEETAQLASYFYCGNKESYNFINGTVSLDGFEQSVLGVLKTGQAIIAKLENTSSGSVKYVVIYGVNTGTHQYKIMDPQGSVDTWIDADTLYSGYGGDTGMVFNGQIVECL